ncbi:hypothetical protein EDB81DRAFT_789377 [Dactylonectria macrodidyma]|uniref:chitinase n=1 Tax=Dactylonectria macrodidyma TaxID=307937 RepID=A0A9P9F457_9HYPO|nr:hypothetical protein EDB81DRAFT_789377 [Dactylonectria macrodidyma]
MRAVTVAVHAAALLLLVQPGSAFSRKRADEAAAPELHNVQLQRCPQACEFAGSDPAAWTTYSNIDELALCKDTVLFTLNVEGGVSGTRIKACSTSGGGPQMQAGAFYGLMNNNKTESPSQDMVVEMVAPPQSSINSLEDGTCGATLQKTNLKVQKNSSQQSGTAKPEQFSAALEQLEKYWSGNSAGCGQTLMFARSGKSVVGAFSGREMVNSAVADLIGSVAESAASGSVPGRYAMQACGAATTAAAAYDTRFGLFADQSGNVAFVQSSLKSYIRALGKCVDLTELASGGAPTAVPVTILGSSVSSPSSNSTTASSKARRGETLQPRAECRDIQVQEGDGCASLAEKCGISGDDFTKYNSGTENICSTLMPKQYVCCSEGDLPDHTPQPNADGTCFTYTIQDGDGCWAIGDAFGIDTERIEKNNEKTFGFAGCDRLQKGQIICLSDGDPPMPAQDPSALCGPWVLGTTRPDNYDDVANLNPCPLNACCDVWGQCGTTTEFCTPSEVDGHPGTAEPGTNGCVSNCGTDIVNNEEGPASFSRVGYFEGFNKNRLCLQMDVTQIDLDAITHIHFAFAQISNDGNFGVTLGDDAVKDQFEKMIKMDSKGVKKILSFGGWSFSTDYDTAPIFGSGVSDANREKFATNVVQFLNDNSLDGLDFDWEYPGAPDIPGSVPGSTTDGPNYLSFLQAVKSKLPEGKSLSIALPASYWYLRGFPVEDMAKVVDYFIYMTYDLHGQWDYGSKWASPGCPEGSCLRSHVNMTETLGALSMVTKAGARTNQIMMGISSYGRSFKMSDPECTGPTCTFTGSNTQSDAEPGECTATGGYIADAELRAMIAAEELNEDGIVKTWYDEETDSDMMTWKGNWVAWMDTETKNRRQDKAKELNLAGTSDWAIDLQKFHDPVDGDDSGGEVIDGSPVDCKLSFDNIDKVLEGADAGDIPSSCRSLYVLAAMEKLLEDSITSYEDVDNNYDGKFGYYAEYIEGLVNPQLANWMDNWETDEETHKGLGNKYFDCKYKRSDGDDYRYEGACPVPKDIMSDGTWDDPEYGYESWIIEYTLRDKEGYEEALLADLGIIPDWVKWEDWDQYPECEGSPGDCVEVHQWLKGEYPRKADEIEVQDPKEIWEQALPEIGRLKGKFSAAMLTVGMGLYNVANDTTDAAVALSVPVSMLAQAVDNMVQVKEIGSEIEEQKKKELILLIVSLVLMVVPFLSEVGFSIAGLAAMARFAFIGGEIANGALSIAEIIDDPSSAPFAIMGMVLGAAGRGKSVEEAMGEAAQARRAMTDIHVSGCWRSQV